MRGGLERREERQLSLCIIGFMQTLRRAHWITRLVLVWFALFVGAAVASPLLRSEGQQMVCSGVGGMKLVQMDAAGDDGTPRPLAMDCPLCMPVAAPAPGVWALPHPGDLGHALPPWASARQASLMGLPWQARAPPSPTFHLA